MNDVLLFDWMTLALEESVGEVAGRADLPDEMRKKIQRLSDGELPEAETRDIFEQIRSDSDAIAYLAGLLRESDGAEPAED